MSFNFDSTKFISLNLTSPYIIETYLSILYDPQFDPLVKKDFSLITTWQSSDKFFEEHANFIMGTFLSKREAIGIEMWSQLLERLEQINPNGYKQLHKGTAYYWAGIYSLFAKRFDEAYQWFEYAFEEDIRTGRKETASFWILLFDSTPKFNPINNSLEKGNDWGYTDKIICKINNIIDQIRIYDPSFSITEPSLRGLAKSKIITNTSSRALRSAWACLLSSLLEYNDIKRSIRISPELNESQFKVNQYLVNLTLILETLIKVSSKANSTRLSKNDIGELYEKIIAPEYGFTYDSNKCFLVSNQITKDYSTILTEIKNAELIENKLAVSFTIAQRVRNSSHHIFNEKLIKRETFNEISLRLYYIIFSVIEKLYS